MPASTSQLDEYPVFKEKPVQTLSQTRVPNSRSEFESLGWRELSALTKVERSLGPGLPAGVNPDVIMSCLICTSSTLSVWLCNARSLACHWRTHLPDVTSLHPSAVPSQYWRELCREACRWLANHFVTVPNYRSGGHGFESLVWRKVGALTKVERSLGSGLSTKPCISSALLCRVSSAVYRKLSCGRLTQKRQSQRLF